MSPLRSLQARAHRVALLAVSTLVASADTPAPRLPLVEAPATSASHEWENAPVLARRPLDATEDPARWTHEGFGTLDFTKDHSRDGGQALRLRTPTKGPAATKDNRSWGYATATLPVANEDWSAWNRLSLWVYPDHAGHPKPYLYVVIKNRQGRELARDTQLLKNHQWNHVLSNFEFLPRDQISSVEIRARLTGHEPGASDTLTFLADDLELQRVEPDHYVGWQTAPGHLAYSHSGYTLGGAKSAIASKLAAPSFQIIDAATAETVLEAPVVTTHTARGTFQLLDFASLSRPGTYRIKAGALLSQPFPVNDEVWLTPLEKALNFYYVLRCGFVVPGVHGAGHVDWRATRSDKSVSLDGGWYDAGDLSQGLYNTAEATRVLFLLAEKLRAAGRHPELVDRLIEEATWGLDWVLKTTLHDGYRPMWAVQAWWTDGIIGTADDPHAGFGQTAENFFVAAQAEAVAARVLQSSDPVRAAAARQTAIEDFNFGLRQLATERSRTPVAYATASAIEAALELLRTTGEPGYGAQARALAPDLLAAQQESFLPGGDRIAGILYTHGDKQRILHSVRGSGAHEHAHLLALSALCTAFPDAPEWMSWYAALARYGDLQRRLVSATAPYDFIPSGVYQKDEYKTEKENFRARMQAQLEAALPIADGHVVRAFPANDGGFGNQHLLLTQAIGLAAGATLRNDLATSQLAERQLEWTLGRNPFARSFMYGEGHRYLPLYSPMNGHIVGTLPVGLPTFGANDVPFWPTGNNQPAPKEVWIQSVTRFVALASNFLVPGRLEGRARQPVEIRDHSGRLVKTLTPDTSGHFRTDLSQGYYQITFDGLTHAVTLLPGTLLKLDATLSFRTHATVSASGSVTFTVRATGSGNHRFKLRTLNLGSVTQEHALTLTPGTAQTLTWTTPIEDANRAWFAVIVPDDDLSRRQEIRDPAEFSTPLKIANSTTTVRLAEQIGTAYAASIGGRTTESATDETARVVERVAAGEVSVGLLTRSLKTTERTAHPQLRETAIGHDGLVLALPATNPVRDLNAAQLRAIWTGAVTNWSALGGPDLPIVPISRTRAYDSIRLFADFTRLQTQDVASGARYRELGASDFADLIVRTVESDEEALTLLRTTPGAISYFPFQFLAKSNDAGISPLSLDGFPATAETLAKGPYLIRRTITAIYRADVPASASAFTTFLHSPAGQSAVENAGFLPLP